MRQEDFGKLLAWYQEKKRRLPWRKSKPVPYEVLVSEFMLQQTRVQQMLPYYERFLKKFPTLLALAQAKEEAVLKAWEGLGYYSRARKLQETAKKITGELDGKMPRTETGLLSLPGIGPYTAAAVSSIAFGEKKAVVDGNVLRVVSRWRALKENGKEKKVHERIKGWLEERMGGFEAGEFNQALMELGAVVCLPEAPLCAQCPVKRGCIAFRLGKQGEFPVRKKKKKPGTRAFACVLLEREGKLLMVKRPEKGLLAGMWELPTLPTVKLTEGKKELERKFGKMLGCRVHLAEKLGEVSHAYTHFRQRLSVYRAECGEVEAKGNRAWAGKREFEKMPLPKVQLKALKLAGKK